MAKGYGVCVYIVYGHRAISLQSPQIPHGNRTALARAPYRGRAGIGFDTRSGNILSFLLPLFQEGQLSVTSESMCTKYWLTA